MSQQANQQPGHELPEQSGFVQTINDILNYMHPNLKEDELTFCRTWFRRSEENAANNGMFLGLIYHILCIVVIPLIANDTSRTGLFIMETSFTVMHLSWFAYFRQTKLDVRKVLFSICVLYVMTLSAFLFKGVFIGDTFRPDEIATATTTYFGISVFVLIFTPISNIYTLALTAVMFSIAGFLSFAHVSFTMKWFAIHSMGLGFAVHLQMSRIIFHWNEARREFNALARISAAERNQMERAIQLAESEAKRSRDKYAGMTQTTQMLAHDIRKPFSMIKALTKMLQNIQDPGKLVAVVNKFEEEVSRSIDSVDKMVNDILAVANEPSITQRETSLQSILELALTEVFHDKPEADISLSYDIESNLNLNVDPTKVKRAVVNILENAVEAMSQKGAIWVNTKKTEVEGVPMVDICIGNNGDAIDPLDQQHLFEAFYSKESSSNLGMGLAIAKNFVEAHGGAIRCSSHKEIGTRFWVTLPIANSNATSNFTLPEHSRQVSAEWFEFNRNEEVPDTNASQIAIENEFIKGMKGGTFTILMIEDEYLYTESVQTQIQHLIDAGTIEFYIAKCSTDALALTASKSFDLIICDVDLGSGSLDGFALVKKLRDEHVKSYIAIHSNRIMKSDAKKAISVGADICLPKPIGKTQLLRVIETIREDVQQAAG